MHIDCEGHGSPTVVLDAGLGNDALIWRRVQPELAAMTRVCSYDRAGYGWSEPAHERRDADHVAAELHALLSAEGVDGKLVLVGHSMAGLYIRDYATLYPEEVVGLVFVDASTPSGSSVKDVKVNPQASVLRALSEGFERGAFELGLTRFVGACSGSFPGYRLGLTLPKLEGICHEDLETYTGEQNDFDLSAQEAARTYSYGNISILIISRDTTNEAWNHRQDSLKLLSADSVRVVATSSGHYVQVDRPDLVVNQIRLFLHKLRYRLPG